MTCALFQWPQIELCLIPTPSNWIVPNSNTIKVNCALFKCCQMKCALFQCHQSELCLIPLSQNEMCLIPFPSNWNVPYSFAKKLSCAHTIPVNDQLLFFGQLEKQSGRSIARIGGEKSKKVVCGVVALLCCAAAVTLCDLFEIAGFWI